MSPRWSLSVLAAGYLLVGPAAALRAQVQQDTIHLQDLVVTATGLPTPADEVVSSVVTIRAQDLRAGAFISCRTHYGTFPERR